MKQTRRGLLAATSAAALSLALAGPAHAAVPMAVWHMNDTINVMSDSSGNANNGALKNVTTGEPGMAGSAFGFFRSPSVVSVADDATLDPGSSAFSVVVHVQFSVRPTSQVGDYDLIRKGLAGVAGGDWKMEIRQDGRAYCTFRGSVGRVSLSSGPNLADNRWHSVTCQRLSTSIRLVIDGTVYAKTGNTGSISNASAVFIGAKGSTGGDQYYGRLDEVSLSLG